MKALDIALKDLTRNFRSFFALAFMFGVPILVTIIFFVAFGGAVDDEAFTLPQTHVVIANLDQATLDFNGGDFTLPKTSSTADANLDLGDGMSLDVTSLGGMLVQLFQTEGLQDLLSVTETQDTASAKAAVDNGEAAVAIIIPANFTDAVTAPEARAAIEFYQDPTLTIGPGIVKSVLRQFIDGFASTKIMLDVVAEQVGGLDGAQIQTLMSGYVTGLGGEGTYQPTVAVEAPPTAGDDDAPSMLQQLIGPIMVGMTIFFAFFTATSTAQSIIDEEEKGTLARLFTTPTPVATILSGKYLAGGFTVAIQLALLALFGWLVFGMQWGTPLNVALLILASALLATTFGIFVISWMENSRQAGMIYGGIITVTGMVGMVSVFTAGVTAPPAGIKIAALLVPQGWAVRAWQLSMDGGTLEKVLPLLGAMLLWSIAFFLIGRARFQKRFA